RETFEHRLPRAVLEVVRIGKRVETVTTVEPAAFSAVDATDFDETIRFRDPRALPEEICIRQAEDGSVASDADSERQRRGQRKHRSTSEGTRGIAHILEERIGRRSRLDVAYPFFHCLQPAELNGRRTTGVVRPHARPSLLVHKQVEGCPQLVIEFALDAVTPHQVPPKSRKARRKCHGCPSSLERAGNGERNPIPLGGLLAQLPPAGPRERVVLRPPIV